MSNRDCIILAFRNLSTNKKIIRKFILGAITIMTLCICFGIIYNSYVDYTRKFKKDKLAKCYYTYRDSQITTLNYKDYEKKLYDEYDVYETALCSWYDSLCCKDFRMKIGTYEYEILKYDHINNSSESHNFYNKNSNLTYIYANEETRILPTYTEDYGIEPLIAGENPNKSGQIMLSKHLLEAIQYDGDYNELVGKNITIGDEIVDYEISGIYDNDIVEKYGVFMGHIYINPREKTELYTSILGYYNDFDGFIQYIKTHNVLEAKEDFYLAKEAVEYSIIYWVVNYLGKIILAIGIVVILVIFFTMIYLLDFYYDRRGRYFLMLRCIGMHKKDQNKLAFIEVNVALLIAAFWSIYASFMFLMLFKIFVTGMFNFTVIMSIPIFALGILSVILLINIMALSRRNKYEYL